MQVLLDSYVRFCTAFRVYLNTKKTKVLVFSADGAQGEHKSWLTPLGEVSMVVPKGGAAPCYKYLGVVLDPKLSMEGHLARAAEKAKAHNPRVRVVAEVMGERMAMMFLDRVVAPSVLWGAAALDGAGRMKLAGSHTALLAEAVGAGHLWTRMPKPKAAEVMWMADSAPWQVLCDRDALSARRALRTGGSVCLAHQREAAEAADGTSLVDCDAAAAEWGMFPFHFWKKKALWKKRIQKRMRFRVPVVKKAMVEASKHDARYGRGSAAIAEATRLARSGAEIEYWARSIGSAATRAALIRFKLGMIPSIKATVYKWRGQLGRYSQEDAAKLMACPCGAGGVVGSPQDPLHLAFECVRTKPFWEEAVAAMDAQVAVAAAPVGVAVAWAGLSFVRKIQWGLTADDAGFPAALAASLHQCAAAAVAKVMAAASDLFKDTPALRDLALPFACVDAPTVVQGMPVIVARPPRLVDRGCFVPRVIVWSVEDCPVAVAPLGASPVVAVAPLGASPGVTVAPLGASPMVAVAVAPLGASPVVSLGASSVVSLAL